MSSKSKIIALATGALLIVGVGIYGFSPAAEDPATVAQEAPVSESGRQMPDVAAGSEAEAEVSQVATNAVADASVSGAPVAAAPATGQTAVKLTKEQLTPPAPKTEDEKLQRAAEQEYDRF
jgi:hypothetical protein